MATLFPGLNGAALADGNGGTNQVQYIQVGNAGSDGKQMDGSNFVMTVPGGQTAGTGNILQHIACQQLPQQLQTLQQQQQPASQSRAKPRRSRKQKLSDTLPSIHGTVPHVIHDALPPIVPVATPPIIQIDDEPAVQTRVSRRKQNFTALKQIQDTVVQDTVVFIHQPKVAAPQIAQRMTQGSRRKRKSPVRSTMADILGEPEFVETYYLDESGSEDEDYSNNVLHLMKERQRRREMTNQFEGLSRLVCNGMEKESRNMVLQRSTKEVLAAKKEAALLRAAKQSLRERNEALRKQLAGLMRVKTTITYESEEEECEKVGGFSGYKSSSSDPDNNDDEVDLVDWGSSVEDSDADDAEVDFKDESESEPEDNVKVELPENDIYEGDREDEEEEEVGSRVSVKDEPESDHEGDGDTEDEPSGGIDSRVKIKQDPIHVNPEPVAGYSPKSSVVNERTEDELELYDRYDRVKIEPRSPVRRALFSDSGSQDEGAEERTIDNDEVLALAGIEDHQPDHFSAADFNVDNEDGIGELTQGLIGADMGINLDPGLIKEEDDDSIW